MCGRFAVDKNPEEIAEEVQALWEDEPLDIPSWNTCPTSFTPVLCEEKLHSWSWGLIPAWAKDDSRRAGLINARVETLEDKPAFKSLIGSKQCIVPISGYYEWQNRGGVKIPYYIYPENDSMMLLAGLWDKWIDRSGKSVFSFTIITKDASQKLSEIHDRMPLVLNSEDAISWSQNELQVTDGVKSSLDNFQYYEVGTKVNSVRNNSAELIKPVEERQMWQGELF